MAQHNAAILTTFNECDMSAVQALRAKSQDAFTKKNGLKLGFMSFFIKAAVEALQASAVDQRTYRGGRFHRKQLLRYRRCRRNRTRAGCSRSCVMRTRKASPNSSATFRITREGARRQNQDRGLAGRDVYHFKRRRLRFAREHADPESAAKRDSRDAQNHGSRRGCEGQSRSRAR